MPLDGYMTPDRSPHFDTVHRSLAGRSPLVKRIMMNPPEAFVQAALAAQPTPPVNNPIVFDQAGQAVMVPPPAPVAQAPALAPVLPQQLPASEPDNVKPQDQGPTPVPTRQEQPVVTPAIAPMATHDDNDTPQSVMDMVTTQTTLDTPTPTSSAVTSITAQSSQIDSAVPSSSVSGPSTTTRSSASHTSSTAIPSSASSAASAAASDDSKPFTQTTGFIFLMVLGALVLVAVAATLCSTFVRWRDTCGCLPCCRPEREDEEDGLSDLVRSFDHDRPPTTMAPLSRVSSMRSSMRDREMVMSTSQHASIERRASLLATSPGQAALLHSTNHVDGNGTVFDGSTTGQYFPGPLRVKNAVEGDMQSEAGAETVREQQQHVAAGLGPRHLGVEGKCPLLPVSADTVIFDARLIKQGPD